MEVEDDGSLKWSFEFEIIGTGEDYCTFVLGDTAKIDDAMESFQKDG